MSNNDDNKKKKKRLALWIPLGFVGAGAVATAIAVPIALSKKSEETVEAETDTSDVSIESAKTTSEGTVEIILKNNTEEKEVSDVPTVMIGDDITLTANEFSYDKETRKITITKEAWAKYKGKGKIKVKPSVIEKQKTGIKLSDTPTTIKKGENFKVKALYTYTANADTDKITWSASPANLVTLQKVNANAGEEIQTGVNEEILVTAGTTSGDVTLTATLNNDKAFTASCTFKIEGDEPTVETKPVCFTNSSAQDSTIVIKYLSSYGKYEYSKDGVTWGEVIYNTPYTIAANGGTFHLRGSGFNGKQIFGADRHITITHGEISLSGNINGLVDYTLPSDQITYATDMFLYAFKNSTSIKSVHPDFLPSKKLSEGCYKYMFSGCTNLTNSPTLPADTLAKECYKGMLCYCSNLITPPELPVETLADKCYTEMFHGCEKLSYAPNLPAKILTESCYFDMFSGCKALVKTPLMSATTLADCCCTQMFEYCESLTSVFTLPNTELKNNCYYRMFYRCKSLKVKKNSGELEQKIFACPESIPDYAVTEMLSNISSSSSFSGTPTANNTYYWYTE